jgi:hypothetical protein
VIPCRNLISNITLIKLIFFEKNFSQGKKKKKVIRGGPLNLTHRLSKTLMLLTATALLRSFPSPPTGVCAGLLFWAMGRWRIWRGSGWRVTGYVYGRTPLGFFCCSWVVRGLFVAATVSGWLVADGSLGRGR